MLQFQINLCRRDEQFCAPTILVTDDNNDRRYPIILPDNLTVEKAMAWLNSVIPIMSKHETIESLSEFF